MPLHLRLLFFVFLTIGYTAKGQESCSSLLKILVDEHYEEIIDSLHTELKTCFDLDSFDVLVLSTWVKDPAMAQMIILNGLADVSKLQFGDVLANYDSLFRKNSTYDRTKSIGTISLRISKLDASTPNEVIEKRMNRMAPMADDQLKTFFVFKDQHQASLKTVGDLFEAFELDREQKAEAERVRNREVYENEMQDAGAVCANASTYDLAGVTFFKDLEQARACSQQLNKRLLLYFSGYTNINSRLWEDNTLIDSEVAKLLNENFVIAILMVDDRGKLPEDQKRTEILDGNPFAIQKKGDQWHFLERRLFKTNKQPLFAIVDQNLEPIGTPILYATTAEFLEWLHNSLDR